MYGGGLDFTSDIVDHVITASGAPPSKQVQVIISPTPWYFVITIPPHHRDQLAQSATRRMQSSELALELAEKWDMYFIVLSWCSYGISSLSVSDQLSSALENHLQCWPCIHSDQLHQHLWS